MPLKLREAGQIIREKDYFYSVEEIKEILGLKAGILCVAYDRVSKSQQKTDLEARKKRFLADCRNNGFKVLAYFAEVKNGVSDQLHKRTVLHQAIQLAEESNAVLVVPCIDRLVRADEYDSFAPLRRYDVKELRKFLKKTIYVVSLFPPDTPKEKARGRMSQWGQEGKGNKGGRPKKKTPGYKKTRRQKFQPLVLKWKDRYSIREISRKIFKKYNIIIPISTIHRWIDMS